jgi:3-keto-5-aminohexanoate cleavage enzyme
MSVEHNKIKWDQVNKWVQRAGLKTTWKAYGMPEALDPFTSRFADIDPLPRWNIPPKILISTAITGAFFSKRTNPHQPITTDEIRLSAEECIKAGAPCIHIHVRDEAGFNVLDTVRFREVIEPLRTRYPYVVFDGCLVAVNDDENSAMEAMMRSGLLDATPINTTAICCGDSMFFKAPHVVIQKARLAMECGTKPIIAVYDDGDIDNARRFLIASELLEKPFYWLILPALPGCSPMHSPNAMADGLLRMVRLIREIAEDSFIMVCAAGRATTYLATFAILLGLHVRVGMEDTVWTWPHREQMLASNLEHFELVRNIAHLLGRELMTPNEYRGAIGLATRTAQTKDGAHD